MFCIQIQNVIWCGFLYILPRVPQISAFCSCLPRAKGISDHLFPLRQLSHELPCLDGYRVILGGCRPGTVKEERSTLLFNTRSLTGLALLIRARLAGRFSGIYPCFSAYTSKGYFTQLIYVDSRVGIQGSHPCVLSTLLSPKPHFFAFTFETGSH